MSSTNRLSPSQIESLKTQIKSKKSVYEYVIFAVIALMGIVAFVNGIKLLITTGTKNIASAIMELLVGTGLLWIAYHLFMTDRRIEKAIDEGNYICFVDTIEDKLKTQYRRSTNYSFEYRFKLKNHGSVGVSRMNFYQFSAGDTVTVVSFEKENYVVVLPCDGTAPKMSTEEYHESVKSEAKAGIFIVAKVIKYVFMLIIIFIFLGILALLLMIFTNPTFREMFMKFIEQFQS